MNEKPKSRLPLFWILGALGLLILTGVFLGTLSWVQSSKHWGSISGLGGYDVRPGRTEIELQLRDDLHQWLTGRGFSQISMPATLGTQRSSEWNDANRPPAVYHAVIQNQDIYFLTWNGTDGKVEYWQGIVCYQDVPQDIRWLPGGPRGYEPADVLFREAKDFVEHEREERIKAMQNQPNPN